jgi:hypothetical protein
VYGSTTQPTTVQIVGTNFLTPSGAQAIIGVSFVGVSASHFNTTDSNNITAIAAPAPANAGYVTVQGVVASATSVKLFTYAAIPGITSFSPVVGPTSGYTPIVITGTNFAGVTSGTVLGQSAPTVSVINPSIVEMTTPPHAAGSGVITLTNVDGTGTSTTPYTYSTTPGDVGVTSVGVGTGLVSTTGAAPITTTGTISLSKAVSAVAGVGGSIGGVYPDGTTVTMNANGMITASGGTVTSITAGTGIVCSPTTITTTGSVGLATASITQLGGVKVDGNTIVIASGTISTGSNVLTQANWNNVTIGGGLTLVNGQRHFLNVAAQTVTLPATPPVGAQCIVGVLPGDTTSVIVGNGQNIMGLNQNMTVNVGNVTVTLEYVDTSFGWRII